MSKLSVAVFAVVATSVSALAVNPPRQSPEEAARAEAQFLTGITQLTSTEMGLLNAGEAYFSPDGSTIIFQGTPIGKEEYQIYTLDLKTRKLKMVSTGKGACTCAFFRPDGKKIIFASSHLRPDSEPPKKDTSGSYKWFFDDYMDIFEADPNGSNLRRLTDTPGYDAEGAYSPDGKRIVFTSKRDGDLEIYVMNADGGEVKRLTHGKGCEASVDCSGVPAARLISAAWSEQPTSGSISGVAHALGAMPRMSSRSPMGASAARQAKACGDCGVR